MLQGRQKVVEMVFGSHLYGLNTPSSDKDFKGVFLPSKEEILLASVPKSINLHTKKTTTAKNTSLDVDHEFYSIQYFFELAKKGETVALDMLHAPKSSWIEYTPQWEQIHNKRHIFYTKTLSSFVGYAKTQAAKYGIKGSRLSDAKLVLATLKEFPKTKIGDIKWGLPSGDHCGFNEDETYYVVCGKKMTLTATTTHYIPMLENFIKEFGERARQAETNQGIDWKAISHAFRAGYQVKSILTEGDFTYPLKEAEFLKQVKSGTLQFKEVSVILENLMDELEDLSKISTLPEKVDIKACNMLLLEVLETFER